MITDEYIMNSREFDEAERLRLQVDSDEFVDQYITPVLARDNEDSTSKSHRFLEVGTGPGHITESIAAKYPSLMLTGIEINSDRLEKAIETTKDLDNVNLKRGDITQMDGPSNHYRYVLCRLVLEHLMNRQQAALGEIYRVLEPGGILVAQSVDHGLGIHFPEDEYLADIKKRLKQALFANNYDPNTGRILKSLALEAGFILENDPKIEVYKQYSHPVSEKELRAYELKLQIGFPMFMQAFGDIDSARKAQQFLLDYVKKPDTLSYTILVTLVAKKPE